MITKDGIGQYKAYGKGTAEEFYTEQFNLHKLITKLLKNMKKSKLTFLMATICLNFSYGQIKEKSPEQNQLQLFQYGFSGFKSGYKPVLKLKRIQLTRVRPSLFETIQLTAPCPSLWDRNTHNAGDVIEPKKLQEIRCYKLFVPEQQIANFYNIMQQNLKMEFPHYQITVECTDNKEIMIITDEDV